MGGELGAVCDEFFVSCRMHLKLDLGLERETVLHFFDRIRKEFPGLKKMRRRDDSAIVLEEESDDHGSRRWIRLDPRSLRFGFVAPPNLDEARRFGELIHTQAPFHLTLGDLDFDHMEVMYGFDLHYRGNHDQLVAETLMGDGPASGFLTGEHVKHIVDAQPQWGVALTPDCDLQAYIEVRSRTSTFEIRRESFETQPITVLLTLRKYWGVDPPATSVDALGRLFDTINEIATEHVVPNFVNPLAAAIASRP